MAIHRLERIFVTLVDLTDVEYDRLLMEMVNESKAGLLHQVDIANGLAELSQHACLPGDK